MTGESASRSGRLLTGRTLRVDTVHGGQRNTEWIRVDAVTREGWWSGGRPPSMPATLGDYRCSVHDVETDQLLFTCGYSSFFDEWRSTSAARPGDERSFSESLRIPEPRGDARFILEGRAADGTFRTLLDRVLRPRRARDAVPHTAAECIDVRVAGDAATCVNLLFVAEGYTAAERSTFFSDVERFSDLLFQIEPYSSARSVFNVRGLFVGSKQSGISNPGRDRHVETFLGASFDIFGIARYMLTFENLRLRRVASHTAYDCLIVLCNSDTYGGGGVFNQYACVAAGAPHGQYLIAHELGHSFAGLADEYYTSLVTYDIDQGLLHEPWQPNVTRSHDRAMLKWGDRVDPDVPLPTPWEQQRYDELAAKVRTATASDQTEPEGIRTLTEQMTALLEGNPYYGRVGAFEGAIYRASGAYRPEVDCLMFSRSHSRFCRVCHQEIEARIANLTEPIA